ncbi:hypothetical protein Ddc_01488 [Ditylenchus destructor]|nr:hypothetical protein Ddc_01488 [Ditylenchus destructor]
MSAKGFTSSGSTLRIVELVASALSTRPSTDDHSMNPIRLCPNKASRRPNHPPFQKSCGGLMALPITKPRDLKNERREYNVPPFIIELSS